MILTSILIVSLMLWFLYISYKIANVPIKEEEKKMLYYDLSNKYDKCSVVIERYLEDANEEFELGKLHAMVYVHKQEHRTYWKGEYPTEKIEKIRKHINQLESEYPKAFKSKYRERKINSLLNY